MKRCSIQLQAIAEATKTFIEENYGSVFVYGNIEERKMAAADIDRYFYMSSFILKKIHCKVDTKRLQDYLSRFQAFFKGNC